MPVLADGYRAGWRAEAMVAFLPILHCLFPTPLLGFSFSGGPVVIGHAILSKACF